MDNYLAFESLLKSRIEAVVPSTVRVVSVSDLGEPEARRQLAPAIFVGYVGDRLESKAGATNQAWIQEWWTVVGVANVRSIKTGEPLREDAGTLLATLMENLGGWTPAVDTYRALQRQTSPQARYYVGYAEFPLLWQTRIIVRGYHPRRAP